MPRLPSDRSEGILRKSCMCGHVHKTHRGERVDMCLDCTCMEESPRCQNCSGEVPIGRREHPFGGAYYDVCSDRCAAQMEYALELRKAAA